MVRRPAATAALAALWLAWFAAGALAEATITARAAVHERFGRIVFDWPAPVAYETRVDGRRLDITFDQPMSVSLDDVRRILDAYIADIHLDADGRSVTAELTGDFQVRAFTYDEKVVVDLMNPSATANNAPLDDEEVEAAADERIRVPVRGGDHPGFSRVVFDWPGAVDYNVTHIGDQVIIRFDRIADFDLANLNASPPKHVYSAETEARGDTARVILVVDPMARLRHFRADLRIVADALVDPVTAETETPAPAPSEPAAPPAKPAEEIVAEAPPDDAASAGEQDARTPPTAATPTPAPSQSPAETAMADTEAATEPPASGDSETIADAPLDLASSATSSEQNTAADPESEAAPAAMAPPELPPAMVDATEEITAGGNMADDEADGGAADGGAMIAAATASTGDSARFSLGPPPMKVSVENQTNRTLVTLDGGKRIAAAAFVRGDHLWVVFEDRYALDLSSMRATKSTAYTSVEQRAHETATVIRFKMRDGYGVTMRRRGVLWLVQFTTAPQPPDAIEVRVADEMSADPRVQMPLARVGDHIRLRDPHDRSAIDVVPVLASGLGMVSMHRFPNFDLLATAQGVAARGPGQIDVFATLAGIEISARPTATGGQSEPTSVKNRARPVTALFDLAAWRRGDDSEFAASRALLHRAIATASNKALGNARLYLARFLFAHGYMSEALGVVEVLVEDEPARAENLTLRAMRGVMYLAMDRIAEAAGDLSGAALDAYDDVALWRGVLAMKQGDSRGAAAFFAQAGDLWLELPSPLRSRIGLMAAEATLESGDVATANAHLDMLRSVAPNYDVRQRVKHLAGRLRLASNDREEAVSLWQDVISGVDRLSRARAIFDDTLLMLEDGQITTPEAINELENLRYAWRADDFELTLLQQLATLYIGDGQYRGGLVTMKLAVTHFSRFRASAAIAARMNELFAEIFLRDGANDLAAIDALTLYYEFQELTPVGAEGDEVIQKLADRLVALDLLDRAAELLEHQLKYRLRGVEKARVGTRLAVIHLMNGTPEGAIQALRLSRAMDMPKDLETQRRHLEARALADLGRDDDALKRLAGDSSRDAELLRADIYWRAGKWANVAAATERLLALTPTMAPLNPFASRHVLRLAVALALADVVVGLARLNARYAAAMQGDSNQTAFDMIADDSGRRAANFRELPSAVAQVASFEAFMSSYRERVKTASLSAIN